MGHRGRYGASPSGESAVPQGLKPLVGPEIPRCQAQLPQSAEKLQMLGRVQRAEAEFAGGQISRGLLDHGAALGGDLGQDAAAVGEALILTQPTGASDDASAYSAADLDRASRRADGRGSRSVVWSYRLTY